jgi:A118 family predicted phage portal protein|nr:MAG TPA: portal protein [Caudoviricetes sp.]
MGIIATVKRWISMIFRKQAEKDFRVKDTTSPQMMAKITECANIYRGTPYWVDTENRIKTINFAKSVCSETARLVTLGIKIQIEGGARGVWLQEQLDKVYFNLRHWVEYGCAYGTVIIKPNGRGLDMFTPLDFIVTEQDDNGNITGIVFKDSYAANDKYYTRLEYHRFVKTRTESSVIYPYVISNRAYVSRNSESLGDPIPLAQTKWADLLDETPPIFKGGNERLDSPMYGVFRTPSANNIDLSSPLGMPIYAEAIEEMKDLDIAYSRNAGEIYDSEKIILADDRLMFDNGKNLNWRVADVKLPHYVKNVFGNTPDTFYQEINPQINTDTRLAGINALLSQIGYKCGFSNGYFVFNESSGIQTATGVEAEQQRTVQFVKDVRDKLESCLNDAIYALSVYADLYSLAPVGAYEVVYDFGDILYSHEADKQQWYAYAVQNRIPFWYYLMKFEGFTEEEARALVEEAQPKEEPGFFQEE